jgi:hypothetical protein
MLLALSLTGIAFGDTSTREKMVLSSQEVYKCLMIRCPDSDELSFDVIARVAQRSDRSLDHVKLKVKIWNQTQ